MKVRIVKVLVTDKRSDDLVELVLLTQAAVSIANTRRRIAEHVLKQASSKPGNQVAPPASLANPSRHTSYEVTVVEQFYQLGQQSFAFHKSVARWERAITQPPPARPYQQLIDVCLFNRRKHEESRIEFGSYDKRKLKHDARKLMAYANVMEPNYPRVASYLILWSEQDKPPKRGRPPAIVTRGELATELDNWVERFEKDAAEVVGQVQGLGLRLMVASGIDLFSEAEGEDQGRTAHVALFEVRDLSMPAPPLTGAV